jgi:putative hydrolase of the HAD superfamily
VSVGATPDAVLFDLDDTLIDYSGNVEACWDAACARVASARLDPVAVARAIHAVREWFWSDPVRHRRERVDMIGAWTKIAAQALERVGHPSELLARAIATEFAARRMATTVLFDDALPCLRALATRGVPLGLVTNGDAGMQREKLARFDLAPHFAVIVIEGEFGAGKPDAAVYHHALAALGTRGDATMMVGDNFGWDVAGATAAGLAGVWLDRAGRGLPKDAAPARVIRSLAELVY